MNEICKDFRKKICKEVRKEFCDAIKEINGRSDRSLMVQNRTPSSTPSSYRQKF